MSESVACSNCSGEILFDDKFCRHCGVSKEVKPAYCPKCKNEWKDDSKFCSNCGSSIRPSDAPSIKPAVTAKNDEATDVREIFRQVWERRRKIQEPHNSEDGIDPKVLTEIPGEEMVDSAEEAYSKGQSAFRQHDYATAAKNYSLAIELDSKDERYYRGRGLCYELNGWEVDWPKAVDDYTQAIRLNPTRADNYLKRGRFWDLDAIRAHEDLETALKLDPSLAEAHYMLGNIWSNAGNHEEAIESFDKGIHLNSGDPYPFLNRARSYGKLGDLNSAIEDYGKAIDLDTTLEAAYFERGYTYLGQNQYSKALNDFEWCIREKFELAFVMNYAGNCFYELGDLGKAEAQFAQLLDIDPEWDQALIGLGKVAYMQNDYPTAIDLFSRAISLNPHVVALNWRGIVRYLSGDYQGALEDYLFCIEQDPPEPWEYHQRCCDCYDALGQYEKAKDSLDKVFELGHGSKELASYQVELIQKLTH